jgi:hypothetical protein
MKIDRVSDLILIKGIGWSYITIINLHNQRFLDPLRNWTVGGGSSCTCSCHGAHSQFKENCTAQGT